MKRYGIQFDTALGISLPILRSQVKIYKKESNRHELALDLWNSGIHEARLLAGMIDDPKKVTPEQMDAWTNDLNSWDICDQVCSNLFQKTPFFLDKAFEYSYKNEEYVKRCGFVLMVQYVVHHKKSPDTKCLEFLKRVEEEAWDDRNFVKKALNWCLRQTGKRNARLWHASMNSIEKLLQQPYKSALWIASNAKRELEDKMQRGLIGNK